MDIKLTGGWNVLDCVLSTCSYCFSLKLEKYLPQLLFLIGFRLALTEGGICMRLEDGSIAEAIALRRLMYRCLAVSSFQIDPFWFLLTAQICVKCLLCVHCRHLSGLVNKVGKDPHSQGTSILVRFTV